MFCIRLVFKLLLLFAEVGTKRKFSISRETADDGRSKNIYEHYARFGCQNDPSLLPNDFIQRWQSNFGLKFCHVMSFCASQVYFEKIHNTFAEETDKLFWTRLKKMLFHFCERDLNTGGANKFVCSSSKVLIVSADLAKKNFEGVDPVFVQYFHRSLVRCDN